MSAETLEELRMLSNINADKDQALQVILVGQNELRDTLRRPDLVQFAQRISVDYHLEPLSEEETANYIRHRLVVAGGRPDIFTDLACQAVHRYSNGVPRLINLLCDTALIYGYAEQKQYIDAKLVIQVAQEKQKGGIFPVFEAARDEDFPAEEPGTIVEEVQPVESLQPAAEPDVDNRVQTAEPAAPLKTESPGTAVQVDAIGASKSEGDLYWEQQAAKQTDKKESQHRTAHREKGFKAVFSRTVKKLWI
jgi:hypothetical protein